MADAPEPSFDELLWTIAVARLIFGDTLSVQAPPNLQEPGYGRLIEAGIDDWGGVSPVTPDHVNPERPWPQLDALAAESARYGKVLTERLAVYPRYIYDKAWVDPALRPRVLAMSNASGLRRDNDWRPGLVMAMPADDVATLAMPSVPPDRQPGADPRSRRARATISAKAISSRCSRRAATTSPPVAQAADALRKDDGRRHDLLRRRAQHQLHQHLLLPLRLLRLLQGQAGGQPARLALRSHHRTRSCGARPRPGTAAPPKSACRAASIPTIPASTISTSAAPCARRSRACTSTPSRRSRSGTAPRRSA